VRAACVAALLAGLLPTSAAAQTRAASGPLVLLREFDREPASTTVPPAREASVRWLLLPWEEDEASGVTVLPVVRVLPLSEAPARAWPAPRNRARTAP
jgi:hypothetical protein